MTAPRVSFILPIYNAGKYLRETLDSIFTQTFSDFEVVAINDGSTDETSDILREYKGLRIVERENRGLVESLNEAIGLARGEYLARMDADDLCMPERLAVQAQFLDMHEDVAVVGSAVETFPNGNSVKYPVDPAAGLLFRCGMAHPGVMMRKPVMDRYKLAYRKEFRCAEDYDLWCRMAVLGLKMRNLPEVLLRYRLHIGQVTQRSSQTMRGTAFMVREGFLKDLGLMANWEELKMHNALACNELESTSAFVAGAVKWLGVLAERLKGRFEENLMQVLTGRFVALHRLARMNGLAVPKAGIFAAYLHEGALGK